MLAVLGPGSPWFSRAKVTHLDQRGKHGLRPRVPQVSPKMEIDASEDGACPATGTLSRALKELRRATPAREIGRAIAAAPSRRSGDTGLADADRDRPPGRPRASEAQHDL